MIVFFYFSFPNDTFYCFMFQTLACRMKGNTYHDCRLATQLKVKLRKRNIWCCENLFAHPPESDL